MPNPKTEPSSEQTHIPCPQCGKAMTVVPQLGVSAAVVRLRCPAGHAEMSFQPERLAADPRRGGRPL